MKYMPKRGKMVVKKWFFRGKKWVFGVEKYELATNLERLNGTKCKSIS